MNNILFCLNIKINPLFPKNGKAIKYIFFCEIQNINI